MGNVESAVVLNLPTLRGKQFARAPECTSTGGKPCGCAPESHQHLGQTLGKAVWQELLCSPAAFVVLSWFSPAGGPRGLLVASLWSLSCWSSWSSWWSWCYGGCLDRPGRHGRQRDLCWHGSCYSVPLHPEDMIRSPHRNWHQLLSVGMSSLKPAQSRLVSFRAILR